MLADLDDCAVRRVINVSGDGTETVQPRPRQHVPLALARARAVKMGVTINALAIETDVQGLEDWYRENLIAGPGSFVVRIDDFDVFAEAIVKKLARKSHQHSWRSNPAAIEIYAATLLLPVLATGLPQPCRTRHAVDRRMDRQGWGNVVRPLRP